MTVRIRFLTAGELLTETSRVCCGALRPHPFPSNHSSWGVEPTVREANVTVHVEHCAMGPSRAGALFLGSGSLVQIQRDI